MFVVVVVVFFFFFFFFFLPPPPPPHPRFTGGGVALPTSRFLSRQQASSGMLTAVRNPDDVIANIKRGELDVRDRHVR